MIKTINNLSDIPEHNHQKTNFCEGLVVITDSGYTLVFLRTDAKHLTPFVVLNGKISTNRYNDFYYIEGTTVPSYMTPIAIYQL